jgi:hypothetical protein
MELGVSAERVEKQGVHANLYKLLLYEAGGHFTVHRDTEKEEGMFGTLVIQLPSVFSGGAMSFAHEGSTKTYELSENCDSQLAIYGNFVARARLITCSQKT